MSFCFEHCPTERSKKAKYVLLSCCCQECESSLKHKTELVARLEAKTASMTDSLQVLGDKYASFDIPFFVLIFKLKIFNFLFQQNGLQKLLQMACLFKFDLRVCNGLQKYFKNSILYYYLLLDSLTFNCKIFDSQLTSCNVMQQPEQLMGR